MIKKIRSKFMKLITLFFTTQIQCDRVGEFRKKNYKKMFLIFNEEKI